MKADGQIASLPARSLSVRYGATKEKIMATYKQIQDDIKNRFGTTVKTCWIAHVKEINGLKPRIARNRISKNSRRNPCPNRYKSIIEGSMRKFKMIR